MLILGQEITAPSWVTARVEAEADGCSAAAGSSFGEITVTVGRDLHPVVRLRRAALADAAGAVLARVPEVEVSLSPRGLLLRREVLPQRIVLRGPELSLLRRPVRRARGRASTPGGAGGSGAAGIDLSPAALDALFEAPPLEAIEEVRAEALVVNYQDLRAGRTWTLDGGRLGLDRRRGGLALTATASLVTGRSDLTEVALSLTRPPGETACWPGCRWTARRPAISRRKARLWPGSACSTRRSRRRARRASPRTARSAR